MAKREISITLRNLKFMQRSAAKEEKKKKKIDEKPNGSFSSLGSVVAKKCVVITDWDPQPKLNEEAISGRETDASHTSSSTNGGRMSFSELKTEPSLETYGDLKRKQSEGVPDSEEQNRPSKSPRSSDRPSPSNKKRGDGFKKPKSRKEAWSVLKPPKLQTNKGLN
ncbi:hypothetical protein Bca101_016801 [Brassica carinata]